MNKVKESSEKKLEANIEKQWDKINVPLFPVIIYVDTDKSPSSLSEKGTIIRSTEDPGCTSYIQEISDGVFYIWVGNPELAHWAIAHEITHLVDGIVRFVSSVPEKHDKTPGDLGDETRAYLVSELYKKIQAILTKKHKYPKN